MPQRIYPRATGIIHGSAPNPTWDSMVNFLGEGRNRYPYTYIVFLDGANAYAQNGESGNLDYNDADHDAVLQYAIDQIEATVPYKGGKILVRGGGYTHNSTVNIMQQNITIEFEPSVSITVTGAIDGFNIGDATHQIQQCHLIGNGALIDHSGAGGLIGFDFYDAHKCDIRGFHITNWEDAGIRFNRSWGNDVIGNWIIYNGVCIKLESAVGAQSNHINIYRNTLQASDHMTADIEITRCENVDIVGNIIADAPIGILDHYSWNLRVEHNYFESNMATDIMDIAVHLQGDIGQIDSPKIQKNFFVLQDATTRGVRLEDADQAFIGFNTVRRAAAAAIWLETTVACTNAIRFFNDISPAITSNIVAGTMQFYADFSGIGMGNQDSIRWLNNAATAWITAMFVTNLDATTLQSDSDMEFFVLNAGDDFNFYDVGAGAWCFSATNSQFDFHDNEIKDPLNLPDGTLSGTPRVIQIDRGGVPYYFKIYPTYT